MRFKFKKILSLVTAAALAFTSLPGAMTAKADDDEVEQLIITEFLGEAGATFKSGTETGIKGDNRFTLKVVSQSGSSALSAEQTQKLVAIKLKTIVFTVEVTGEVAVPFELDFGGMGAAGQWYSAIGRPSSRDKCNIVNPMITEAGLYNLEISFGADDPISSAMGLDLGSTNGEDMTNNPNTVINLKKINVNGNLKKENPITLSVPQTEIVEGQEDVLATVTGNEAGLPVIYELFYHESCMDGTAQTDVVTDELTKNGNLVKGYTGEYLEGGRSYYLRARTEETEEYFASYSDVIRITYMTPSNQSSLNRAKGDARRHTDPEDSAYDGLNYTEESREALRAVLDEIEQSITRSSTQEEVDAAEGRLRAAIDELVIVPASESEINELKETVEKAKLLIESDYTSWAKVYQKLSDAEAILAQGIFPYYDVTSATSSLKSAISNLVPADTTKELAALASVIEKAESCDAGDYTSDSLSEVSKALEAAKAVPEGALKSVIDSARTALENALAGLKAADTTEARAALAQEIANAKAIDADKYTEESYAKLTAAIEAAENLSEVALNSEINAAAQAIRDAVAGLVVKPAGDPGTTNTPAPSPDPTTPNNTANDKAEKDKAAAKKAMKKAKLTKVTAKSKAKKKIAVSWKKVSKAKGYEVQVSAKKNFKKLVFKKATTKKKLTIAKKVKSKKTYFVRVRAYATYKDAKGKTKKVYSSWSKKAVKVKVK